MTARERLAVALDVPDLTAARALAQALQGRAGVFKVGLELFVSDGPAAVEAAAAFGAAIFLDLKLHDIPRTVGAAVRSAGSLGAKYLTLHALGGPAMIAAARDAAETAQGGRAKLLAVTVLTSHDEAELRRIGLGRTPHEEVLRLAEMSIAAGADGLVCSPQEIVALRQRLGPQVLIVTPGVRPRGSDKGDQARVATPGEAIRDGASLLVVGRPIVAATDPGAAADAILQEIAEAMQ
ncbi:MAG: orotidine-5'-phosphate decarboxylase [Acidobacteriota bacterium]